MKHLILFILLIVGISLNAQPYIHGLNISPDHSKNNQYIAMSSNGKKVLSNKKQAYGHYETKGMYKDVLLTDFVEAMVTYIDENDMLVDKHLFSENLTADHSVTHNGGGYDFSIDTLALFHILAALPNTVDNTLLTIQPSQFKVETDLHDGAFQKMSINATPQEGWIKYENGDTTNYVTTRSDATEISANDNTTGVYSFLNVTNGGTSTWKTTSDGSNATGIKSYGEGLRFFSSSGNYEFIDDNNSLNLPVYCSDCASTTLAVDTTTGQIIRTPSSSGSGEAGYYEAILQVTLSATNNDTATIYNTFPHSWDLTNFANNDNTGLYNGFQIDYNGCGVDDVDCVNATGTPHLESGLNNGQIFFAGTPGTKPSMMIQYMNTDSVGFYPYSLDGTALDDDDFPVGMILKFHIKYFK